MFNTDLDNDGELDNEQLDKKIEDFGDEKIQENTIKNYKQDSDIGILYDRTNSREETINKNVITPANESFTLDSLP